MLKVTLHGWKFSGLFLKFRISSLLKAFYFLCKTIEKLLNSGFSGFLKFPTFTHVSVIKDISGSSAIFYKGKEGKFKEAHRNVNDLKEHKTHFQVHMTSNLFLINLFQLQLSLIMQRFRKSYAIKRREKNLPWLYKNCSNPGNFF